jgi:hypothetical protein
MDFLSGLPEYGEQLAAPKPQPGGVGVADIQLTQLPEYGGAPPKTAPQQEPYRFNTLPLSVDEKGNYAPAVPGLIKNLYDTAVSGITAPADVLSGALPTPYTGTQRPGTGVNGKVPRYDANLNPEPAINRAADFGMTFGADMAPSAAGVQVPGTITKSQGAPSISQLKSAADQGYAAARGSLNLVPAEDIAALARATQENLINGPGLIAKRAPGTHDILDEIASPPTVGPDGNVGFSYNGLAAAREQLSEVAGEVGSNGLPTRDAKAAKVAIDALTPVIDQNFPEAGAARGNYAAAMRSNDITGDLNRANTGFVERADARAHATHSGQNVDNTIRQRVASFLQNDKNLAGFSKDEIDALNKVVEGGRTQNAARAVGNWLGGGRGIGTGLASAFGLGVGHYFGGPEGGEIGMLAAPTVGMGAKAIENALARRSLNPVDEMVRSRSPLAEAMAGIDLRQPNYWQNNAALRAMLPNLRFAPGTFNPASQPVPSPLQGQRLADFLAAGGA